MKNILPCKQQTKNLVDIDYTNIIAVEAHGKKYLFSVDSEDNIVLVSGDKRWSAWNNIQDAIKDLLEDKRVQLYYFESIADLAAWLKS